MKTNEEKFDEIIEIIDEVIESVKKVRNEPPEEVLQRIFEYERLTEDQMVDAIKYMLGYGQDALENELSEKIRNFIRENIK